MDYGYFRERRKDRWWRVHVNSFQVSKWFDYNLGPRKSWRKYDRLPVKPFIPYTKKGNHILVCPPTPAVSEYFNQQEWLDKTIEKLKQHTTRPIKIRYKPSVVGVHWENGMLLNDKTTIQTPADTIENDFNNCWAMVTYNSAMCVEALQHGIPVFSGPECASWLLGNTDLAMIENPSYNAQAPWFWSTAEYQYTLSELMQTDTWRYILKQAGLL